MLTFKSKLVEAESKYKQLSLEFESFKNQIEAEKESIKQDYEKKLAENNVQSFGFDPVAIKKELDSSIELIAKLTSDNSKLIEKYNSLNVEVESLKSQNVSVEELATQKAVEIVASQGIPVVSQASTKISENPLVVLNALPESQRFAYFQKHEKEILEHLKNNK